MANVWVNCSTCKGVGSWQVPDANGRMVQVLCTGCGGSGGHYINV